MNDREKFEQHCVPTIRRRMDDRGILVQRMEEVLIRYGGDYVIPYPEMPEAPAMPDIAPALVGAVIDGHARRAASVQPAFYYPPMYPNKSQGYGSIEWADVRRRALGATFHKTGFKGVYRRAFRQLFAYDTLTIFVRPDPKRFVVCETASPLATFPEPKLPEDQSPLCDCGFVKTYSAGALRDMFPACRSEVGGLINDKPDGQSEMWHILEWWDEDSYIVGIMAPAFPGQYKSAATIPGTFTYANNGMQFLEGFPNLSHRCPVVVPQAFTLEGMGSALNAKLGVVDLVNRLLTLDVLAQERGIFPDRYIIGAPNDTPRIEGGAWKDGRTGQVNILAGVQSVGELRSDVGVRTGQLRSELEDGFRQSVGLPNMMTGEAGPNMRTGRAQDTVINASVDPIIQEAHELMEMVIPQVADLIFTTYEAYYGQREFTMFSGWPGTRGHVTFTPDKQLKDSHEMVASYAIAGADVQSTTVELGQLRGLKLISAATARRQHPHIDDADAEDQQVNIEDLDQAAMQSVVAAAVNGQVHPAFIAKIRTLVAKGMPVTDAIEKAFEWEQAQQQAQQQAAQQGQQMQPPATQVPMPTPAGGMPPDSPAAQMAGPQGALNGMPSDTGPTQSQVGARQLLMALRSGESMRDSAVS